MQDPFEERDIWVTIVGVLMQRLHLNEIVFKDKEILEVFEIQDKKIIAIFDSENREITINLVSSTEIKNLH